MLFAFGLQLLKQYHILDDKNRGNLFSRGIAMSAAFAAFIGLGVCNFYSFIYLFIVFKLGDDTEF